MGLIEKHLREDRAHPSALSRALEAIWGVKETASGANVTETTALGLPAFWACVRVISEDLASLPLPVYKRLEGGGKDRARDHPLYPLLHDAPNPEMSSFIWRETCQAHLLTWGNSYSFINWGRGGRPVEIYPLLPNRMQVKRVDNNIIYEYRFKDAEPDIIPAEKILHIPGLGFDGLVGYSPVAKFREAIGLGLGAEEYAGRFFGHGAGQGIVLRHPAKLSDDAHGRIKKDFDEKYAGLGNAFKTILLEEGMEVEKVGFAPADAQLIESRKFSVVDMARIFRIPLHKVQSLDAATYSNIEQQSIEYVVDTLRPWLVRWEGVLKLKLFREDERDTFFAEFLVDALLRGDIEARYKTYAIARQWGLFSADDVMELENRNPLPESRGKVYMVPLNMQPAPKPGQEPLKKGSSEVLDEAQRYLLKHKMEKRSTEARRRIGERFEGLFKDAAAKIIRREKQDVMAAAEKFLKRRDLGSFVEWLNTFYMGHPDFIEKNMSSVFHTYAESIADELRDELNITEDITAELEVFLASYASAFATRHVGSSLGQLKDVATTADLATEADVLDELRSRFEDWEETRPGKIARRETRQLNNAIAKEVMVFVGVTKLVWRASGGDTCPYCQDLDGQVVGIEQNFVNKGDPHQPDGAETPMVQRTNVSHPPLHDGCVCSIEAA